MSDVPVVGRDDVLRILQRDFSLEDPETVLRVLDEYGTERCHQERDRVHLAILKHSGGSIGRLRQAVEIAKSDCRDAIAPGEYPEFWKLGFSGVTKLDEEAVGELKARDWRQYHAWLHADTEQGAG